MKTYRIRFFPSGEKYFHPDTLCSIEIEGTSEFNAVFRWQIDCMSYTPVHLVDKYHQPIVYDIAVVK